MSAKATMNDGAVRENTAYVGIDIQSGRIALITRDPDHCAKRGLVTLHGFHGPACDGTIYLREPVGDAERQATDLALSETEPVGLGWTFRPAP